MRKRPADPARVHDAARLLPMLGALLLMPPIISLFVVNASIAGVPLIVVYLFGTWVALIGGAAWLARRLAASEADPEQRDAGEPPG